MTATSGEEEANEQAFRQNVTAWADREGAENDDS